MTSIERQKKSVSYLDKPGRKMPEIIVLVDEKTIRSDTKKKLAAHRDGGKLHRAFSILHF